MVPFYQSVRETNMLRSAVFVPIKIALYASLGLYVFEKLYLEDSICK